VDELRRYAQTFGFAVEMAGDPFVYLRAEELQNIARELAEAKVVRVTRQELNTEPLYGEIDYERRRIVEKGRSVGLLYDAIALARIYERFLPPETRSLRFAHLVFTDRLIGTWDPDDLRYHARVSLYNFPSIISTTGLVEAPARPREYYFLRQQYELLKKDPYELKQQFRGRFLDYDDERTTEVMKGYVLQALVYAMTGEPFCQEKTCRLYNAHWQEEMLQAQLGEREFCEYHRGLLQSLTK